MKAVIKGSVYFSAVFFLGCSGYQYPLSLDNTGYSSNNYFEPAPREGWATDPIYSYRVYSYYPYNFYQGGFGVHSQVGFNRFGF